MNLDELSTPTYALLLFFAVSLAGALSFPLMNSLKRHLDYLQVFRRQNRRMR